MMALSTVPRPTPVSSYHAKLGWQIGATIAAVVFSTLAVLQLPHHDPFLWVALYAGAALMALPVLRRRPVPSWSPLAISVVAAEMALMRVLVPPVPGWGSRPGGAWVGDQAVDLLGCALVATWGAALVIGKPYEPEPRRLPHD